MGLMEVKEKIAYVNTLAPFSTMNPSQKMKANCKPVYLYEWQNEIKLQKHRKKQLPLKTKKG